LVLGTGFLIAMAVTIMLGETIFYLEEKSEIGNQNVDLVDMKINDPILHLLDQMFQSTGHDHDQLFQEFSALHDDMISYVDNFNFVAEYLLISERSHIAQAYYNFEFRYHKENKLNLYKCVKSILGTNQKSFKFLSLAKIPKSRIQKFKAKLYNYRVVEMLLKFLYKNPVSVTTVK